MLYDSLQINNFPLNGENRLGETTGIVRETLMGFAGEVACGLSHVVGELRGISRRNLNNVLFASWLMFAPVIAPVSAKASNINNANSTSVGLQQGDGCEAAIAEAIRNQCAGAVNGTFVGACDLPNNLRVQVGSVQATRDPYKEVNDRPVLAQVAVGPYQIFGSCSDPNALAHQARVLVDNANGSSMLANQASQLEVVDTPASGTPDVPTPQPTIDWIQTCTVDGVQTLSADYIFPERQYYPTTEDPNFDPERVGEYYFVVDTRYADDVRSKAVFDQLNELLRVVIPWGVQITDPRAIELLNDPRFPRIFMGNKQIVITHSEIVDIVDFLNCVAPELVTQGNPPIIGPTPRPLSAPERFSNSVGDSMGNFGNWLRGIGAWLRNLGSWIGGGQGSSENSGPMITSTENRSSESGNISSVNSENHDSEIVALREFYNDRIRMAPNRQARKIWARRALRAGC